MAIELVCSCGQLLRFEEPPVGGQARCPECHVLIAIEPVPPLSAPPSDSAISAESPAATRKPLWAIMGRGQNPPATAGLSAAPAAAPESHDPAPSPPATEPASPSSGRKGLWSVMQTPATSFPVAIPGGPVLFESVPTPGSPESNPKSQIQNPKSDSESPPDSLAALIGIAEDEALLSAQNKAAGFQADNSRRASVAAVLGGLSIPLSGLALINAAWSRLPSTALGFVAILTGLIASQEIARSGGRKTGRRQAITGIVTGIIGSFLGPVVIAPLAKLRRNPPP